MGHWHGIAIDWIMRQRAIFISQMSGNLVSKKIKINPSRTLAANSTAQYINIKLARFG
jgi:hypothetical protein